MAFAVIRHNDTTDPGLPPAWAELSRHSPSASLFTSYEWCQCWAETLGSDAKTAILRVIDGDAQTIGLLPLCISETGGVRWLQFMGRERTSGDHLDLLHLPGQAEACLAAILDHLDRTNDSYDGLILGELEPGSATLDQFTQWADRHRYPHVQREHRIVPYVDLPETFEEYLASRSANMRYHVRRRCRDLEKQRGAVLEVVRRGGQVDDVLSAFFDLHQRRWERDDLPGNFRDAAMQEFLRRFCAAAAERDWLRCYVLTLNGAAQCVMIVFHWGDTAYYYQIGWDPASPIQSPGVILMAESIKQAIAEGLGRYDFLRGDEAYKLRWTSQAGEQTTWVVGCRRPARAAMASERMKNHVKTAIQYCFGQDGWRKTKRLLLGTST